MPFTGIKPSPEILLLLKHTHCLPRMELLTYSNVSQRNNLIKLKHYDEIGKRTHDSQIGQA